jgi:biopolymer transport protein ExbD
MARFIKQRRRPSVNISALMDIAFILVIFVVLGATFQRIENISVTLPQADARSTADSEGLRVVVHAHGGVDIDGTSVAADAVRAQFVTLADRHDAVLLVADRDASVQTAVSVLSDAQAAGFASVAIATQTEASTHGKTHEGSN